MRLKDGCKGCNRLWGAPGSDGECSRCHRCLNCCSDRDVPYSCVWKAERREREHPGYRHRSDIAYGRYEAAGGVFGGKKVTRNQREEAW